MENLALFGRRVRSVREAHGHSREAAAERAGITASYLGEIKRGEKWPSLDVLATLAISLGTILPPLRRRSQTPTKTSEALSASQTFAGASEAAVWPPVAAIANVDEEAVAINAAQWKSPPSRDSR